MTPTLDASILATDDEIAAFWAKVDRSGEEDACWPWQGSVSPQGYGQLYIAGQTMGAHVVAYQLAVGPVPAGLVLRHACDIKLCVRPSHLTPGTHRQNREDWLTRGRFRPQREHRPPRPRIYRAGHVPGERRRGERHPAAKLTEMQVREIRRLRSEGMTYAAISERYGVTVDNVRQICTGRTWRHVREDHEANGGQPGTPTQSNGLQVD